MTGRQPPAGPCWALAAAGCCVFLVGTHDGAGPLHARLLHPSQAACDAAHAEVARQKWLALELERQSTRADAAVCQVEVLSADKAALSAELDKVQVSKTGVLQLLWRGGAAACRLECDNTIGREGKQQALVKALLCVSLSAEPGRVAGTLPRVDCLLLVCCLNTQAEAQQTAQSQQHLQQEVSRLRSKVHQRGFEALTQQQLLQVAQQQIKQTQQQVVALQQELAVKQQQMQQQEQQAAASKAEAADAR